VPNSVRNCAEGKLFDPVGNEPRCRGRAVTDEVETKTGEV